MSREMTVRLLRQWIGFRDERMSIAIRKRARTCTQRRHQMTKRLRRILAILTCAFLGVVGAAGEGWAQPAFGNIAFTSYRDGNEEIYVMNAADGSSPTNLTNNASNELRPSRMLLGT